MRVLLATILLFLVSCSTVVPQDSIELTTFDPIWECHVGAHLQGDKVLFTASSECSTNRTIPFTIEYNGNTVYDGGVYAHNTTSWTVRTDPGVYEVVHGQYGGTIATIEVR